MPLVPTVVVVVVVARGIIKETAEVTKQVTVEVTLQVTKITRSSRMTVYLHCKQYTKQMYMHSYTQSCVYM